MHSYANNYLALFSHCLVGTTGKVSPVNTNLSAEPEDLDAAGTSTFKESSCASCSVQQSQLKADIRANSCVITNRTVATPVTAETSMHLGSCKLEVYGVKIGLRLEVLNVQIHSFKMTLNIHDPTYVQRAVDTLKKILNTNSEPELDDIKKGELPTKTLVPRRIPRPVIM